MKSHLRFERLHTFRRAHNGQQRRGSVLALFTVLVVVILAFTAFTVDIGFVALSKHQLQNASDAAAHAAALELRRAFGPGAELTTAQAQTQAKAVATDMINRHRSGDRLVTPADADRDVRIGKRTWNSASNQWVEQWDVGPYNMVEVTARRVREDNTQLPLMFASIWGHRDVEVTATSTKALYPVGQFSVPPGSTMRCDLFPFTVDIGTWTNLLQGTPSVWITDSYGWDAVSNQVTSSGDGIPELNIYPDLNSSAPPGNRGTVDLGAPNNSTNDIKRQILYGLNEYDFSFFPNNTITLVPGPLILEGDTGISAGFKDQLEQIIGQVRAMPIFTSVSGNGNNARYTIVKFVGIRIMAVKLTGGPNNRYLRVQPAPYTCQTSFRYDGPIFTDTILSGPVTVH